MLQYVLSDMKGASCIYFMGSYRSNEVPADHAIFSFMNDLESCNVRSSKIHLDGMEIDDVNHIISDALGTLPRICKPLSQLVLRKTKGNPLFVLECLRSLVDRDLVSYSFRERRWAWDTDAISSEGIADNVSELLTVKMIGLSVDAQLALKIASCFGTSISSKVVTTLMAASSKFDALQRELDRAVDDGFINKDGSGRMYKFSHDKVREAAYGLISEGERDQFHYSIGMLLYHATERGDIDDIIFLLVDQINHGEIQDPKLRISVALLNYHAASKAMRNSNIEAAEFYANAAIKLLPKDHWQSKYELSLQVFLVLGNAAYTNGHSKEAVV